MIKVKFASVSWCVEDVIRNAEEVNVQLTVDEAETLLRDHEDEIADAMVTAGWEAIERVLLQHEKPNGVANA